METNLELIAENKTTDKSEEISVEEFMKTAFKMRDETLDKGRLYFDSILGISQQKERL